MPEIRLDQNTSLQQLKQFSEQLGDNAKIRGRANDDGSITLYTSSKRDWGIKEFFTGHVTRRQETAKQALENIVSRLGQDPGIGEDAKELLTNIKTKLPTGPGELRGSLFKERVNESITARNEGLKFEQKTLEGLKVGDRSLLNNARDTLARTVAGAIGAMPREQQMRLMCSDGREFMDNVALMLRRHLGQDAEPHIGVDMDHCSQPTQAFLKEAFDLAMTLLPDRVLDDNTVQIDGKTYEKVKELDRGGFGAVDLYRCKDDESTIVLKRPLLEGGEEMKDKFDEASREALSHLQVVGEGSENVVGLKGTLRTPDGGLLIALETAPHGNLYKVSSGLQELVKDNLVPKEIAQLAQITMLKDMLQGMQHMHDQGMVHQDVKTPNFLMGEGGVGKLSDFGTSVDRPVVESTHRLVDEVKWLAPEVISGHNQLDQLLKPVTRMLGRATPIDELRRQFEGQMPAEELEAMLQKVQEQRDRREEMVREKNPVKLTQGVDTWSIGASAHQMLFEGSQPLTQTTFMVDREEKYTEFMGKPESRVFEKPEGGQLTDEQKLVNDLMMPRPEDRMSPGKALENPIFQREGVGGEKIREFLSSPVWKDVFDDFAPKRGQDGGPMPLTDEAKDKVKALVDRFLQA